MTDTNKIVRDVLAKRRGGGNGELQKKTADQPGSWTLGVGKCPICGKDAPNTSSGTHVKCPVHGVVHKYTGERWRSILDKPERKLGATESHGYCGWCGKELPPHSQWPYVQCPMCELGIKEIEVYQAEGDADEGLVREKYKNVSDAQFALKRISWKAPDDGSYYKTDVLVHFKDGTTWRTRFDVMRNDPGGQILNRLMSFREYKEQVTDDEKGIPVGMYGTEYQQTEPEFEVGDEVFTSTDGRGPEGGIEERRFSKSLNVWMYRIGRRWIPEDMLRLKTGNPEGDKNGDGTEPDDDEPACPYCGEPLEMKTAHGGRSIMYYCPQCKEQYDEDDVFAKDWGASTIDTSKKDPRIKYKVLDVSIDHNRAALEVLSPDGRWVRQRMYLPDSVVVDDSKVEKYIEDNLKLPEGAEMRKDELDSPPLDDYGYMDETGHYPQDENWWRKNKDKDGVAHNGNGETIEYTPTMHTEKEWVVDINGVETHKAGTMKAAQGTVKDKLRSWTQEGDRIAWYKEDETLDRPNYALVVNDVGLETDSYAMIFKPGRIVPPSVIKRLKQ